MECAGCSAGLGSVQDPVQDPVQDSALTDSTLTKTLTYVTKKRPKWRLARDVAFLIPGKHEEEIARLTVVENEVSGQRPSDCNSRPRLRTLGDVGRFEIDEGGAFTQCLPSW